MPRHQFTGGVAALIGRLQRQAREGRTQVEILGWLHHTASDLGYSIRYDQFNLADLDPHAVEEILRSSCYHDLDTGDAADVSEEGAASSSEEIAGETIAGQSPVGSNESPANAADAPSANAAGSKSAPDGESAAEDEPPKFLVAGHRLLSRDEEDDGLFRLNEEALLERIEKARGQRKARLARQAANREKRGRQLELSYDRRSGYLRLSQPSGAIGKAVEAPYGSSGQGKGQRQDRLSSSKGRSRGTAAAAVGGDVFKYLGDNDMFAARVQLCRRREAEKVRQTLFHDECSSIVIDALQWQVLALVPRPFAHRYSEPHVNSSLAAGDYHVFRTNDGSLLTLYCWVHPTEGFVWCIATTNGYDVSHLKGPGGKTWSETLLESMEKSVLTPASEDGAVQATTTATQLGAVLVHNKLGPGDFRLEFDNLNPTACYTVSFRHHDMHPLRSDPEGVWGVQWIHLHGSEKPTYQPVFEFDHAPCKDFLKQEELSLQEMNLAGTATIPALTASCQNAISDLIAGKSARYGYILRSRDIRETRGRSDIIIDSPLVRFLRETIYERISTRDTQRINPQNRNTYNAIRAILAPEKMEKFLSIFPEYRNLAMKCQQLRENTCSYVIESARQRAHHAGEMATLRESPVASLGTSILQQIDEAHPGLLSSFKTDQLHAVIMGYLTPPAAAVLYLPFMTASK